MKTSTKIIISSIVTLGVATGLYFVVKYYNDKKNKANDNVTAESKLNQVVFTRA